MTSPIHSLQIRPWRALATLVAFSLLLAACSSSKASPKSTTTTSREAVTTTTTIVSSAYATKANAICNKAMAAIHRIPPPKTVPTGTTTATTVPSPSEMMSEAKYLDSGVLILRGAFSNLTHLPSPSSAAVKSKIRSLYAEIPKAIQGLASVAAALRSGNYAQVKSLENSLSPSLSKLDAGLDQQGLTSCTIF
jgi:hypothetical protein